MKKIFVVLFLVGLLINISAYSFSFKKLKIKKKAKPEVVKMVETREEYDAQAKNIPLEERILSDFKPQESNKKVKYPTPHFVFEKYNYPPGRREVDIDTIKGELTSVPFFVVDKDVKYCAYLKYFFNPDSNQISSNLYVENLDKTKSKVQRVLDFHDEQQERKPILESGTKEIYTNLYKGLGIVDWNSDSTKLLIKEKIGSLFGGIYSTNVYIYNMPTDINSGKLLKLDDFSEAVKYYYLKQEDIQLSKYSYDIVPIGFSAENDNIIIIYCFVYDKNNNKIFLGTWAYDYLKRENLFISKKQTNNISSNGLILKQIYD